MEARRRVEGKLGGSIIIIGDGDAARGVRIRQREAGTGRPETVVADAAVS